MQLVFLALALVRTVWRMPRYYRTDTPPSVRAVRQMRLWPEFADETVHIRIAGSRTLQRPWAVGSTVPACAVRQTLEQVLRDREQRRTPPMVCGGTVVERCQVCRRP